MIMAVALFILGHAASGKTTLAQHWVKSRISKGEPWCMMDKDDCGDMFAPILMQSYGLDPNDRDSVEYKDKVRDLEYITCLNVAKEQLKLGINVVLPGPWTKELKNGDLFNNEKLGFPAETTLSFAYLDICESIIKQRIVNRGNPRDAWKINNWDIFAKTLKMNPIVQERNIITFKENDYMDEKELMIEQRISKVKSHLSN